jgi:hypothetical protein
MTVYLCDPKILHEKIQVIVTELEVLIYRAFHYVLRDYKNLL